MKTALLIGIERRSRTALKYDMNEIKNLARSLKVDVTHTLTQSIRQVSSATKIGKGKLDEAKALHDTHDFDYVIFNEELTNTQIRNIEEVLDTAILDKTLLILEIFARRAKTKEAMLQVEVAQLKYLRPRLSAMRDSFSQQQGGIGQRGPGEKKLELDRRKIDKEINTLQKSLDHIVHVRKTNRIKRSNSPIKNVSIVGYTNAGKSTLMNVLLNHADEEFPKHVDTKDRLFETLETSTRRIKFKDKKPFTLTDTIGFISNLPHELVESFKATLEEIKEADLLLHVVDFSHPYYMEQIETTNAVLNELGASDIETIYVFNKIDLIHSVPPPNCTPSIKVSLKTEENIDELIHIIHKTLFKDDRTVIFNIPQKEGDIVHMLNEYGEVLETYYEENSVKIKARVSKPLRDRLEEYIA
ncbi:MAG: GTPase HflX [Bacillota bacterium]